MALDRTFPSAVDGWLAAVLGVAAALVPALLVTALTVSEPVAAAGFAGSALFVAATLAGLVWPVRYTLASEDLIVRSGLVRYRVPYREIYNVAPTRSWRSSPALSLDRLRIDYGVRWLFISPQDRRGFLALLRQRAPHLRPTPDGGLAG